jgi:hypothetical protein
MVNPPGCRRCAGIVVRSKGHPCFLNLDHAIIRALSEFTLTTIANQHERRTVPFFFEELFAPLSLFSASFPAACS